MEYFDTYTSAAVFNSSMTSFSSVVIDKTPIDGWPSLDVPAVVGAPPRTRLLLAALACLYSTELKFNPPVVSSDNERSKRKMLTSA